MDWFPLILSIEVATTAAIASSLFAIPIGRLMARKDFWGKGILETLFMLPMVLPPTVVGFVLMMILGPIRPLGAFLSNLGLNPIFTPAAAIIASTIVAFPLMYLNAKAGFGQVDINLEKAACTLGAGKIKTFFTISLPLAFPGLLAGFVLAFARALGEFGATMMVAGNIPGRTQTLPMAIYFAMDAGKYGTAAKYSLVVTIFCFAVILWSNWWQRKNKLKQ